MAKQTSSGAAWEWAVAQELAALTRADVVMDDTAERACHCFSEMDERRQREHLQGAARVAGVLVERDPRLARALCTRMLPTHTGRNGDPTDIRVDCFADEVNVSAKKRSREIKAPRLSHRNDWVREWTGAGACSEQYWSVVRPVFQGLARSSVAKWSELAEKRSVYARVRDAFVNEMRLHAGGAQGVEFVSGLFAFVMGRHDYWRVSYYRNGVAKVEVEAVNPRGTLKGAGTGWKHPRRLVELHARGDQYADMAFDGGWAFSARLHNASSRLEPSLKWSVSIEAVPRDVMAEVVRLD